MVQYLPLDKAAIISTVLEGALYGFSVLMFIATIWTLVSGRKYSQIHKPMVVAACLLFILSTLHIISDIKRIYSGLVVFRDTYPGGPPAWFANTSDPSFIFKNAVYSFQTALGDGVVIYRCYMVWRSIWVTVVPGILWLVFCASAVGSIYTASQREADSGNIFAQRTGQWITAFYVTTLACNLCATVLLAYKLWMVDRSVRGSRVGKGLAKPVMLVIIDAGALYSVTLLAALICFVSKSNGQYVVLDMATPIVSITFYMVILRTGLAQNAREAVISSLASMPQWVPLSRSVPKRFTMQVHVEQLTEGDHELAGKANEADSHLMSQV